MRCAEFAESPLELVTLSLQRISIVQIDKQVSRLVVRGRDLLLGELVNLLPVPLIGLSQRGQVLLALAVLFGQLLLPPSLLTLQTLFADSLGRLLQLSYRPPGFRSDLPR